MTRIYLAGPFFSERQIEIIDSVEKALAKKRNNYGSLFSTIASRRNA